MSGQQANPRLIRTLVLISVAMFGFGFAMWPLYDIFCDVTGFGGRGVKTDPSGTVSTMVSDREINVRFDATVNSGLPWNFQPSQKAMTVKLGKISQAQYLAFNTTDAAISGHAIYNVTPPEASLYFVKTECFCFTEQILEGQQTREMPVLFYVKPDLPEKITEITLSYTFFKDEGNDKELGSL